MLVYALTSSQSPRETLDLFLTRDAAEAELREILQDEPDWKDVLRVVPIELDELRNQYLSGVQDPSRIDPDNWVIDKALIDRPGVDEIMLDLLYDIRNQAPVFEAVQELLRDRRPRTLVATGANDEIFPEEVVRQILTDLPDAEYHALQTGHFALEDKAAEVAALMRDFLPRTPAAAASTTASPTPNRSRSHGKRSR